MKSFKISKLIIISILLIGVLGGCGSAKKNEVIAFKENLINQIVKETEKHYNLDIKDYDFSIAEEVRKDEFEAITSLDNLGDIYVIANLKTKTSGKEVEEIVAKYDYESKQFEYLEILEAGKEEKVNILNNK